MKGVMIATPMFGGMCHSGYTLSLVSLTTHLSKTKVPYEVATVTGESLIPIARNQLVSDFLKSNLTHMIFIDADLTFKPQDVTALYQLNRPVVGGLYLKKNLDWDKIKENVLNEMPKDRIFDNAFSYVCYSENADAVRMLQYDKKKKEVFPVIYLGTGFMMIKREVFEKLMPFVDTYKRGYDTFYDFFRLRFSKSGMYLSEDFSFCQLCSEQGIQVECAPWTKLLHTGNMDYGSHLDKL